MQRFRLGTRIALFGAGALLVAGCSTFDPLTAPLARETSSRQPGAVTQLPASVAVTPLATLAKPRSVESSFASDSLLNRTDAGGGDSPSSKSLTQARFASIDTSSVKPDPSPAPANTLDLGIALQLAGVDNPTINLAREAVEESLSDQLAAQALLIPSVNIGANFRQHTGPLLAAPGFIRTVDIESLYVGGGAGASGAGPPVVPGIRLFAHLGDAFYEPLAARQRVSIRRSEAQAVQNAILLDVAAAYIQLVGAERRLEVLHTGESDLAELSRVIAAYAKTGQGRQSDANRVEANLDLLRREIHGAEEDAAVASAVLCRLLSLDPSVRVRTPQGLLEPFTLVPEDVDVEKLIADAQRLRPELAARSASIREAQTRVRQERVRPWVPVLSAGYSYAGFGGGSNQTVDSFTGLKGRSDFDLVAVWNWENLGFGNRARERVADSEVGAAVSAFDLTTNQVRREIAEALAEVRAKTQQIGLARAAVDLADEGFKLEQARTKQGQARRPIEVLDSFRQLLESRQELLRAVVAFDIAQFRLYVATGSNPIAGNIPLSKPSTTIPNLIEP